jgi:hypothetical protein
MAWVVVSCMAEIAPADKAEIIIDMGSILLLLYLSFPVDPTSFAQPPLDGYFTLKTALIFPLASANI